jgi:hypothetical protein
MTLQRKHSTQPRHSPMSAALTFLDTVGYGPIHHSTHGVNAQ